ncbi:hypothetical protein SASPL_101792 [Salvia splendens]|uniref:Uncharacterized protein n=1 Tax=Salvia splendens TaxID=180675 RepID=A0A8X9ACT9_SALSN|nr:hypothetical protein SASPL_101792 [Salvia splendens]
MTVEEEHCEKLGSTLLMDSKSETEVEDVCGDDASNSDATGVSISSIALLGEKHRVEEDRAVSPADHQVSASEEIYWLCSSDVNNILSTAPLPTAALLSDVDGDIKCLLQGHTHDEWDICLVRLSELGFSELAIEIAVEKYVRRLNVGVDDVIVEVGDGGGELERDGGVAELIFRVAEELHDVWVADVEQDLELHQWSC